MSPGPLCFITSIGYSYLTFIGWFSLASSERDMVINYTPNTDTRKKTVHLAVYVFSSYVWVFKGFSNVPAEHSDMSMTNGMK